MLIFEKWLSGRSARRTFGWFLSPLFLLTLLFGAGGFAEAQPVASNRTGAAAPTQPLRQELLGRYEVLPLRDGVMLRPRTERAGVRSIEVSGDAIAVNGERVSESVLRAWLAEDSGALLRLLALPVAERRALFGFGASGAAASIGAGDSSAPAGSAGSDIAGDSDGAEASPESDGSVDGVVEIPPVPEAPVAPEEPEEPQGEDDDSKSGADVRIGTLVRFAGSARVDADEQAEEVVVIGGPAIIDGAVQKDVAAIGGRVTVNGRVGGDVVAVGGSVRLGPKAEVGGDVTSVGGSVERAPGARVRGQINEAAGIGPRIHIGGHDDRDFDAWPLWGPFAGAMRLMWSILALAILALMVAVTVVVARDSVARVEAKLATEPWQSGLAGFLAQLLFIPLFVAMTVVLVVSIIGIPLLILYPFLFLALILGGLVGFSAVCLQVGRLIDRRFDRQFGSVVATALVGLFAIEVLRILGNLFDLGSGPLGLFGWFFSLSGFLVAYAAWTFGFGAVILTRFGLGPRRPRGGSGEAPIVAEVDSIARMAPIPPIVPPPIHLPEDEPEAPIEPEFEPEPESDTGPESEPEKPGR